MASAAAAEWPRYLLGMPVREVLDDFSADKSQPCWLASHGSRYAIMQMEPGPPAAFLGNLKITWVVDAKRLQTKDRMLVSPAFELPMGRPIPFRLMVQPKDVSHGKGGESFAKARGFGSIQLKCEEAFMEHVAGPTVLAFRLAVGTATWRGPVRHDFAAASAMGLPVGRHIWNFRTAVDSVSQTVTILLDVECP